MSNNWSRQINGEFAYGLYNEDYFNNTAYRTFVQEGSDFCIRKGIRNGHFVIDQEIVKLGFSMEQNIGWINLIEIF